MEAVRTLKRFREWGMRPNEAAVAYAAIGGFYALAPAAFPLALAAAGAVTYSALKGLKKDRLPIKKPIQSGELDANESRLVDAAYKAEGILYLGKEPGKSGKQVWLSSSDICSHMGFFGTQPEERTKALMGVAHNAMLWGSGFVYCDGKGNPDVAARIISMARALGRLDDVIVVNTTGGATHSFNPMADVGADVAADMLVQMMGDQGSGDGAMWLGRAMAMLTAVMRALVYLRDEQGLDLTVDVVREYLSIKRIIDLADPNKTQLPKNIRNSVRSYLTSLPGFQEDKGYKQAQITLDQHGYLEMQFTRALSVLADVCRDVFVKSVADLDLADAVRNRRIVVAICPAMTESSSDGSVLARILVRRVASSMASRLQRVEGSWVQHHGPVTNRENRMPYMIILDDISWYSSGCSALMMAQARSCGIGMVVADDKISSVGESGKDGVSVINNIATVVELEPHAGRQDAVVTWCGEQTRISAYKPTAFEGAGCVLEDYVAVPQIDRQAILFELNAPTMADRLVANGPAMKSMAEADKTGSDLSGFAEVAEKVAGKFGDGLQGACAAVAAEVVNAGGNSPRKDSLGRSRDIIKGLMQSEGEE